MYGAHFWAVFCPSLVVSVLQVCGGGTLDSRAEQCAAFNSQEFMGRLYNWEPFTEGEDARTYTHTCAHTQSVV